MSSGSEPALRRLSVLIPVYNGRDYVARAVESALAQTHADIEIVIVNDGSPDDPRDVLAPYLALPNVKYIEQANAGVAAARNTALRACTGRYVALLDQDDLWCPRKAEQQVAVFESRPEVALVHGDVGYIAADGSPLPHDPHFPRAVQGDRCLAEFFVANPVMACTAMVRRSVLDEVGGFDEAIRFSDDYDLWLRIVRHHAVAYIDEPLAKYRLHESNESRKVAGIVAATMQVLRKALAADPECRRIVGLPVLRVRFSRLYCALSRHWFTQRRWGRFAACWLRAWWHDGATARELGLPNAALDRLRWYARRLHLGPR